MLPKGHQPDGQRVADVICFEKEYLFSFLQIFKEDEKMTFKTTLENLILFPKEEYDNR